MILWRAGLAGGQRMIMQSFIGNDCVHLCFVDTYAPGGHPANTNGRSEVCVANYSSR